MESDRDKGEESAYSGKEVVLKLIATDQQGVVVVVGAGEEGQVTVAVDISGQKSVFVGVIGLAEADGDKQHACRCHTFELHFRREAESSNGTLKARTEREKESCRLHVMNIWKGKE